MDSAHLASNKNRYDNFTPALSVAGNMSRELEHVWHENGLLCGGGGAADTLAKADLLASGFTHERAQEQELVLHRGICSRDCYAADVGAAGERRRRDGRGEGGELVIADIEAGPIDRGGGRG